MGKRILVVDDDPDLQLVLEVNLMRAGYKVAVAATGQEALEQVEAFHPDLIVLDWMLPDISGPQIAKKLITDQSFSTPILMLTARDQQEDRINGLESGVDDYLVKPFNNKELLLRVAAILRRTTDSEEELESFGILQIDRAAHRVWVSEKEVILTALEFKLLHTFMQRKGRVQQRAVLLADVWGIEADVTTRTVDTHVKRLRKKLGAAGEYILTLRGVGYRFVDSA